MSNEELEAENARLRDAMKEVLRFHFRTSRLTTKLVLRKDLDAVLRILYEALYPKSDEDKW